MTPFYIFAGLWVVFVSAAWCLIRVSTRKTPTPGDGGLRYRRVYRLNAFQPSRKIKQQQKGQVLVEAVIIFPVACLACIAALDILLMTQCAGNSAFVAQQVAECAAQGYCTDPVGYGTDLGKGLGLNPQAITITSQCDTHTCTANVNYNYQPFGPWPVQSFARVATAGKS